MKKTIIFLFAGLLINTAAFAEGLGPKRDVNCKEIADKVKQAKAAAAQAQQPAASDDQKTGKAVDDGL
jgi:hypothetical protein